MMRQRDYAINIRPIIIPVQVVTEVPDQHVAAGEERIIFSVF